MNNLRTGGPQQILSLTEKLQGFAGAAGQLVESVQNEKQEAYVSSVSNDIRENVSQLMVENSGKAPGDYGAFNTKSEAYKNAVLSETEGFARGRVSALLDDTLTNARIRIHAQQDATDTAIAENEIELGIQQSLLQANDFAFNGDTEGALLTAFEETFLGIDGQVDRGLLSPAAAQIQKDEILLGIEAQGLRGDLKHILETDGALAGMKALDKMQSTRIKGLRDDQKQKVYGVLVSELQASLSLDAKIETEEDDLRKKTQDVNATTVTVNQYRGKDVTESVLQGMNNGSISLEDGNKILARQRKQGQGTDSWDLIYDIQKRIDNGESVASVNADIDANAGGRLTFETAANLRDTVISAQTKSPRTNDPSYKAAKEYLNSMLAVRGIMGSLDTESERRIGRAEMELFKRTGLGNEDPLVVVDELVDKTQITKAASSLDMTYGTADDIPNYKKSLQEAAKNGTIDKGTFDYRWSQITNLEQLIQSSKVFGSYKETLNVE